MFRNILRGLCKTAVVVPVLAGLVALTVVGDAGAFHRPTRRPKVIRPNFARDGLDFIGVTAITGDQGALLTNVDPGGRAFASGFRNGDVIQSVDGVSVRTSVDLDNAVQAGRSAGEAQLDVRFLDGNDFSAGQQAAPLYLQP